MQAQTAPPGQPAAPAQPPPKVGTITVKFVGTANVNEQIVRANMSLREGGEFDGNMLDRDLRSLYRTGLFELIEFKQEASDATQTVFNFVIEVTPKFRVYAVRFEGNLKEKSTRLEKEIKTKPNLALDERQVKEDAEKLRDHYQKAGYNQVSVTYAGEKDRAGGFGPIRSTPRVTFGAFRSNRCINWRTSCATRWWAPSR